MREREGERERPLTVRAATLSEPNVDTLRRSKYSLQKLSPTSSIIPPHNDASRTSACCQEAPVWRLHKSERLFHLAHVVLYGRIICQISGYPNKISEFSLSFNSFNSSSSSLLLLLLSLFDLYNRICQISGYPNSKN